MSPVKEELSGGFGGFYANIQQQCKYFFIKFISNLEDALYSNSYTLSFPYQEKKNILGKIYFSNYCQHQSSVVRNIQISEV
jgi:hypothetical protein